MDGTTPPYNPNEVIQIHPGADALLERAMKVAKNKDQLAPLLDYAPPIETVNLRLATFMSSKVNHPLNHSALFQVCISDAIHAFAARKHLGASSSKQVTTYLSTLVHTASYMLRYEIVIDEVQWHPLYSRPLMHAADKRRRVTVRSASTGDAEIISMAAFERRLHGCLWRDHQSELQLSGSLAKEGMQ